MRLICLCLILLSGAFSGEGKAQPLAPKHSAPGRLSLTPPSPPPEAKEFPVPLPAHAQTNPLKLPHSFRVESSREPSAPRIPVETGSAHYLLREKKNNEVITPEAANLNLPADTVVLAKDSGEKITLPAGTYRQILTFPIDSPLLQETTHSREQGSPTIETEKQKSRYAPPPQDPLWVRYESLEKIKIGEVERRGGLDVPSHGPTGLKPRVWYAKSETSDIASSAFYFVFGGLGYSVANLAGWSTGNTRELTTEFEYRLVQR